MKKCPRNRGNFNFNFNFNFRQGAAASRGFGTAWWAGVLLPPLALFGAYLMVRATWLTLRNDGIDWRGTHYPLAELRANVV